MYTFFLFFFFCGNVTFLFGSSAEFSLDSVQFSYSSTLIRYDIVHYIPNIFNETVNKNATNNEIHRRLLKTINIH